MTRLPTLTILPLSPTTAIHTTRCANCPSQFVDDPEVAELQHAPRDQQLASVFRCAWRNEKLCKGYCDRLQITQEELQR